MPWADLCSQALRKRSFAVVVVVICNVKETRGMLITFNGTWQSFSGGGPNLQKTALLIC